MGRSSAKRSFHYLMEGEDEILCLTSHAARRQNQILRAGILLGVKSMAAAATTPSSLKRGKSRNQLCSF